MDQDLFGEVEQVKPKPKKFDLKFMVELEEIFQSRLRMIAYQKYLKEQEKLWLPPSKKVLPDGSIQTTIMKKC